MRAEKQTQQKRQEAIAAASDAPVPKLRKGRHGWLHNSRMGLAGTVRYWAKGSCANVIKMLLKLMDEFDARYARALG